jgi:hypothetical protein
MARAVENEGQKSRIGLVSEGGLHLKETAEIGGRPQSHEA